MAGSLDAEIAPISEEDLLISLGSPGLKQFGGYVDEEFLNTLRGPAGTRFYKEMSRNNSVIGTLLYIISAIIRQTPWRWETQKGYEEDPTAIAEKDFMESTISDMSHTWEDFISEVLSMIPFGWSFFEMIFKIRKGNSGDPQTTSKYNDGRWGFRKFEIRGQETLCRWIFDDTNHAIAMEQQDTWLPTINRSSSVIIPFEKALLFRTVNTKGNPEGESLLRPSVIDYHFQKNIQKFEAIGIERNLAGLPVMEVPVDYLSPNASAEKKTVRRELEKFIQTVKMNERMGALIPAKLDREGKPTGFSFGLLSASGKTTVDTDIVIKRYDNRIAMTFLGNFVLTGQNDRGTQSLFEGQANMFTIALKNIMTQIAAVFNKFAVGRLMELNGVSCEYWPVLVPGDLDSPDLDKLGSFVQNMAAAGLLSHNSQLENKLLSFANLPIPDPEDDTSVFSDPTMPTPRDPTDQISGLLSTDQISMVSDINRRVADRDLDIDVARELLAAGLGMGVDQVDRFVKPPEPRTEPPPPLPQTLPDANTPGPDELSEPVDDGSDDDVDDMND